MFNLAPRAIPAGTERSSSPLADTHHILKPVHANYKALLFWEASRPRSSLPKLRPAGRSRLSILCGPVMKNGLIPQTVSYKTGMHFNNNIKTQISEKNSFSE